MPHFNIMPFNIDITWWVTCSNNKFFEFKLNPCAPALCPSLCSNYVDHKMFFRNFTFDVSAIRTKLELKGTKLCFLLV